MSLLDLNADLDIALDAAAPIDLGVAANANVAAPIEASVGANVLSVGSAAQAVAAPGRLIDQGITGDADGARPAGQRHRPGRDAAAAPDATAAAPDAARDRRADAAPAATAGRRSTATCSTSTSNLDGDLNLAAPIDGAVAANANVAAPIDASVAANVGSVDSVAAAIVPAGRDDQQNIDGDADATADQSPPSTSDAGSADRSMSDPRTAPIPVVAPAAPGRPRPRPRRGARARADGVELLGEVPGSGYRRPPALARRGDGQVVTADPAAPAGARGRRRPARPSPRSPRRSATRPGGWSGPTTSGSSSTARCARSGCSRRADGTRAGGPPVEPAAGAAVAEGRSPTRR